MTAWCYCEEHELEYPCADGCPYCRAEKGELVHDKDNPSVRFKPLRRQDK